MYTIVLIVIFVGCVFHAMWTDALRMTISNWVSIILLLSFGMFAALNLEFQSTIRHLGVACAVFAVTFCCYIMRWIGGGDVKFLSALSAWMGPQQILPFLIDFALLGGVLALFALIVRHGIGSWAWANRFNFVKQIVNRTKSGHIPYAVPIGCAALISSSAVFPLIASSSG